MRHTLPSPFLPLWFTALLVCSPVLGQAAGQRGAAQEPPLVPRLAAPDAATAERVITVEAVAAVRVVPTCLRLVFAISATGADGGQADRAARERITATRAQLQPLGIAADAVDVDFIAALPVYAWQLQKQNDRDVLVEAQVGVRVQNNLHVRVADEAAARTAIAAATTQAGVTLLAVDYWSDRLDAARVEAETQALAQCQAKSQRLLRAFPQAPTLINVHEATQTLFPQQLYRSIAAAEDSAGHWYSRDELPRLPASRPLHVYYRGLFADLDAASPELPGQRHIEVVSTVRLYFAAPERPALAPATR